MDAQDKDKEIEELNQRIQTYEEEKIARIHKDSEWHENESVLLEQIADYEKEIEELKMDLRSSVVEKEKGQRFDQIIQNAEAERAASKQKIEELNELRVKKEIQANERLLEMEARAKEAEQRQKEAEEKMREAQEEAQEKLEETQNLAKEAQEKLEKTIQKMNELEGKKVNLDFEKDRILREN